jgi:hypothetical protein
MRNSERLHTERLQGIEKSWKERYQSLKETYEAKIHAMDDEYFEAQLQRELELEALSKTVTVDQEDAVRVLEAQVREAETTWNRKVAQLVEDKADEMESVITAQRQFHAIAAAKKRKEYEGRICELVSRLQRIKSLEEEHEECIQQLEGSTAPLMHLHDAISSASTFESGQTHSNQYIQLKKLLNRFDGNVSTTKPLMFAAASEISTPARRGGLADLSVASSPFSTASRVSKGASPVFPMTPVGRVKLSKSNYVDAQAKMSAVVEQSASRPSMEPVRIKSPFTPTGSLSSPLVRAQFGTSSPQVFSDRAKSASVARQL